MIKLPRLHVKEKLFQKHFAFFVFYFTCNHVQKNCRIMVLPSIVFVLVFVYKLTIGYSVLVLR